MDKDADGDGDDDGEVEVEEAGVDEDGDGDDDGDDDGDGDGDGAEDEKVSGEDGGSNVPAMEGGEGTDCRNWLSTKEKCKLVAVTIRNTSESTITKGNTKNSRTGNIVEKRKEKKKSAEHCGQIITKEKEK